MRTRLKLQANSYFQRTPGSHPSAYLQPTRARTERSLKLPPAEPKSVDERPRKPSTQILQPQQPNRGGQVQKQPSKVVLQPGAPGATPVASTPNQREQAQQQQQQQQKGPMGLFKKIYRKMNFRAASDCTVEPLVQRTGAYKNILFQNKRNACQILCPPGTQFERPDRFLSGSAEKVV